MDPDDDTWAPRVRSDVTAVPIDHELVVFDPVSSQVHQLNPTAAIIWQFLDGSVSLGDLARDLADAFEVPLPQVREQLSEMWRDLLDQDLLAGSTADATASLPSEVVASPVYLVDPPAP